MPNEPLDARIGPRRRFRRSRPRSARDARRNPPLFSVHPDTFEPVDPDPLVWQRIVSELFGDDAVEDRSVQR